MKKIFLMLSVMFALVATSYAQTPQAADPIEQKQKGKDKMKHHGKRDGAKSAKSLGLNNEQKAKMKTSQNDFKGKMSSIKSDQSMTKEQKKAKMKEIAQAHDAQLKSTLTPEQYTQMTEMRKNRMAQGGRKGGKHGKRGAKTDETPAPVKN
jgi:Spy/CpxP family protein refolding chaperone